jgi:hypothetical protein
VLNFSSGRKRNRIKAHIWKTVSEKLNHFKNEKAESVYNVNVINKNLVKNLLFIFKPPPITAWL